MSSRRVGNPMSFTPYVPRAMLQHLTDTPESRLRAVDGTCLFADVSGFTKLSERLARRRRRQAAAQLRVRDGRRLGGREGAEHLADAIGSCCERLLAVAYANGGGLLKFGGDALLLLFDGDSHAE